VTDLAMGVPVASPTDFTAFYAEHCSALTGYAYQLTRDAETARDLAHEAFTRLLARWVSVREPKPWLFHVVTNLARDSWQARSRRQHVLDVVGHASGGGAVAAPDLSVADAVRRLPKAQAEVILLFYYSDLPLAEVAAAVRRPTGTVKWLLAQAREQLALALEDPR
jgi:RNA polymerase sigma-70 factor (ECF subfamily)